MSVTRQGAAPAPGFSLLEALIALVIVMVGLLGIAGLQALAVRNSAQAHIRTMAAAGVRGLAAGMRANSAYWTSPSAPATVSIAWSSSGASISPSTLAGAPNCTSQSCSPSDSAAYDLGQWALSLATFPPGTAASITRVATAGTSASAYAVQLTWNENRMQGQGATATGNQLESTTVFVKP